MRKREKKRRGFLGWLRAVFALVLILALLAAGLVLIPLTEREDKSVVEGSADWMARLDDDLPLNRINLPGTHDSATQFAQLAFFTKCQAKSIAGQLEAGFRYLDIRLGVENNRLKLMHGFADCRTGPGFKSGTLYLDRVLESCYTFLEQHPTETIVFAVKQEHGSEPVAAFQALLSRQTAMQPERWLLTDTMPTLGEARGKLVLMRRYEDAGALGPMAGLPLLWEDQKGHEDTSLNTVRSPNGAYDLWVQDRFEYKVEEKWGAFQAGMLQNGAGEDDIALNFLSTKGSFAYGHPYRYARSLNKLLMGTLLPAGDFYGWVVVDFASAPLAQKIYATNFA